MLHAARRLHAWLIFNVGQNMKLLLLIFSVLVVAGGLLLLYFTPGKFPYYPFEEISEGHLVRVPDERVRWTPSVGQLGRES